MQKFFDKTIDSVESIRNQISFMRALQELGLIAPKWQPVSQAFHDAARLLPENTANIHADAGDAEIFADPLLPRAFFILLDNTLRNSTTVPVIRLSARRDNADLIIVYEDNTPGVPPEEKEKLFEVGYDRRTYHGLFLVQELLSFTRILIRETGVYGTGVRFEIVVPRGKFRFSR
jgi:signal transduction histidine kinase